MLQDVTNTGPQVQNLFAGEVQKAPQSEEEVPFEEEVLLKENGVQEKNTKGKTEEKNAFQETLKSKDQKTPVTKEDLKANPLKTPAVDGEKVSEVEIKGMLEKLEKQSQQGVLKAPQKTNVLTEENQVMLNFMDSIESEVGVPPTRMVEAMTKLTPEELVAPPEKTAKKVIRELNLSPQKERKALALYRNFLRETKNIGKNTEQGEQQGKVVAFDQSSHVEKANHEVPHPLRQEPHGGIQGAAIAATAGPQIAEPQERSRLAPRKPIPKKSQPQVEMKVMTRREKLNTSLDSMNDRFFLNGEHNIQKQVSDGNITRQIGSHETMTFDSGKQQWKEGKSPIEMGGQISMSQQALQGKSHPQMESLNPRDYSKTMMRTSRKKVDAQQKGKDFIDTSPQHFEMSQDAAETVDWQPQGQNWGGRNVSDQQSQSASRGFEGNLFGEDATLDNPKEDTRVSLMRGERASGLEGGKNTSQTAVKVGELSHQFSVNSQGTEGDAGEGNVQNILNRAQFMIRQGGGEMKVQLNPEGLGQVHLKVGVNNGQVDVQMVTDTPQAKKVLENSIQDLKANLVTQKLGIESIKVDLSNDLAQDSTSREQSDMQRESARQFLGEFRDENFSSRQSAFDLPGFDEYKRKRGEESLEPENTEQNAQEMKTSEDGRLHVVA